MHYTNFYKFVLLYCVCIWYSMCLYVVYVRYTFACGCQGRTVGFSSIAFFLVISRLAQDPLVSTPLTGTPCTCTPSCLPDSCLYPCTANTFTQWDISIPPIVCTVFNSQQRVNKVNFFIVAHKYFEIETQA